uniref:Secreted protein n=1 Tax=Phakopsora pachyrhizi TaxID=170000 RepID=A0A0S1MIH0_PHAPC
MRCFILSVILLAAAQFVMALPLGESGDVDASYDQGHVKRGFGCNQPLVSVDALTRGPGSTGSLIDVNILNGFLKGAKNNGQKKE